MIPDEPVRGRFAYLEHPWLLSMTGLEQFEPFLRGRVPLAPLYNLTGLVATEAALGTATFTMPATGWWQSSAGVFFGGTYAFVADAALGGAVFTVLPPATALATSEISMSFLRPASVRSGHINARGRVIQAGRNQGLSEALIEDAHGRLLAHATSRCVLTPLPFDPPPRPDPLPEIEMPAYEGPDPWQRPADGALEPKEMWDTRSGLEFFSGWVEGRLPNAPVGNLFGWKGVLAEEGKAAMTMPASEWFCTAPRGFYGGALAVLADAVMGAAIGNTLPPASSYATLDLKVHFLRPVDPDGRELMGTGVVVHRGRRMAVATADVTDADGKRVAMATTSALIFEGRSWIREGVSDTLGQTMAPDTDAGD
ncbi:MAG TPA: PaaI family thioesterase [Actinomycetota bacterium]|nr:PaaI family thioesterase [Actinomycetota bacterium]